MGIISIVTFALGLFSVVWAIRLYNRLIKLRTFNEEGWSGVLVALKRRRALISSIVKATGVQPHESEALWSIARAQAREQAACGVTEAARAEAGVTAALAGFRAIVENHPDLKENMNMIQIQEEFSALEDRIEKTRRYYNATVRDFNMEMDRFPANLVVELMGFKRASFFETEEQQH
jgi:LemA protein